MNRKSRPAVRQAVPRWIRVPIAVLLLLAGPAAVAAEWVIGNPYAAVDWERDGRYKANLHTHTTVSDGQLNPHDVVDMYHRLGYRILSLTDHNAVTYPWERFESLRPSDRSRRALEEGHHGIRDLTYENRDPAALGMIAIEGNELSSHHHMGSYFCDHNNTTTEEASLEAIGRKNGLAVLFHPGRYTAPGSAPAPRSVEWYANLYRLYPWLIGMEVFNAGDRYPLDRDTWDAVLTEVLPERTIWGFSNDDMHSASRAGFNWNVFLLPELTEAAVRAAMESGAFLFVHAPRGHPGPPAPEVRSIAVDPERGVIEIRAEGHDRIEWISEGRVVHWGDRVELRALEGPGRYIRAMIHAPGDMAPVVGTQPFEIRSRGAAPAAAEPRELTLPVIRPDGGPFVLRRHIDIGPAAPGVMIRYTLDGSDPVRDSPIFLRPFAIAGDTTVKARRFRGSEQSGVASAEFQRMEGIAPVSVRDPRPGLAYRYFENERVQEHIRYAPGGWTHLPDFPTLTPLKTGIAPVIGIELRERDFYFAMDFEGYLRVPADGVYLFAAQSDDGFRLTLAGRVVIDHDGIHGPEEVRGTIALQAGFHPIRVEYFDAFGDEYLEVFWQADGLPREPIPPEVLFHRP